MILGVVASLLLMAVVIVLVVRSRCAHVHKPEVKMVYNKGVASPSRGSDDDLNSDDPNPDVIPINDGEYKGPRLDLLRDMCRVRGLVVTQRGAPSP